MQSFSFHYGPRLIVGGDGHHHVPDLLPEGPCLFVTDDNVLSLGLAAPYVEALEARGATALFSKPLRKSSNKRVYRWGNWPNRYVSP